MSEEERERRDPDSTLETRLLIDDLGIEDKKERGLRTGLRVTAVFDGLALVVIIVAILVQISNRDNYIFLLNIQHVLWWFVTVMLTGVAASKLWYNVYIGLTAVWLVMDSVSLIWRAVLLHECYGKSSSNSCRDFIIQAWFIIIANGVLIVTCIIFIILAVLLRRSVIEDRMKAKQFEEDCKKRQRQPVRRQQQPSLPQETSCPSQSCPQRPSLADTQSLLASQRPPTTFSGAPPSREAPANGDWPVVFK